MLTWGWDENNAEIMIYANDCIILHSINDEPAYESDGWKYWFKNGMQHRDNGPAAISSDEFEYWWVNGKRHRIDGPAENAIDGMKWFLDGVVYDFHTWLEKTPLSIEEKVLLKLRYG